LELVSNIRKKARASIKQEDLDNPASWRAGVAAFFWAALGFPRIDTHL